MSERNLSEQPLELVGPKIAVIGVGGAGSNAIDNMIRLGLKGVNFIVCNTDAQALSQSLCSEDKRIRLGFGVTQGLGAGSSPDVGRSAAEESIEDVMCHLDGVHMLFVTAGMGGGTGTGGAPVIAEAARKRGILTVGVVTKPFHFEGAQRMKAAEKGIEAIKGCVDTLLVIPNQNLFRLATETTTFAQAFAMADDVLYSGVRTFTDLMIKPGLVNLDFADICTVMKNMMGKAMMGTGEATGDNRATEAAEKAIGCLLLDDVSIKGARAVLINITGGPDLTLYEVDEAIGRIKQEVDAEDIPYPGYEPAHIIFGATFDHELKGLRVSVVATGIHEEGTAYASSSSAYTMAAKASEDLPETPVSHSLGNRHEDFSFEQQHFSSFNTPEENTFEYSAEDPYHLEPVVQPQRPRKRSLFERLTGLGKRAEPSASEETRVPPKMKERPASSSELFPDLGSEPLSREVSSEDLSIPAFLRDKRNSFKGNKAYKK